MKTLFATLALSLLITSVSSAITVKADLKGDAAETQTVRMANGNQLSKMVGSASLVETGRSQSRDNLIIYLTAQASSASYLSVLHDASMATLTLDLNAMRAHGEASEVDTQLQIQGDDDQFRKASGECLINLDSSLLCTLTPTFNAFGLLENTELNLNLN